MGRYVEMGLVHLGHERRFINCNDNVFIEFTHQIWVKALGLRSYERHQLGFCELCIYLIVGVPIPAFLQGGGIEHLIFLYGLGSLLDIGESASVGFRNGSLLG